MKMPKDESLEKRLHELSQQLKRKVEQNTEQITQPESYEHPDEPLRKHNYGEWLKQKNITILVRRSRSPEINRSALKEEEEELRYKLRKQLGNPAVLHSRLADVYTKLGDYDKAEHEIRLAENG